MKGKVNSKKSSIGFLCLGALGVVYGDIGTSPIYALKQSLDTAGTAVYDIYGVISLIFWSLVLVVSFKYLVLIFRADNNGEGGILTLFSLLPSKVRNAKKGLRAIFVAFMLFGTALLIADGMLTPAISVLSATEGIEAINPSLAHLTVPITVLILVVLFAVQYKGTESIGKVFGPIILMWFLVLGFFGWNEIKSKPEVLQALQPNYAIDYINHHGIQTFVILSSVILAITGAEALYADMGHFGKRPIRVTWLVIVFPALILNYLGQAAFALQNPNFEGSLFFALAPNDILRIGLVILATAATIIASQALITAVASLTRQAIRLGLLPRLKVVHTSDSVFGQIYVPIVNLIVGFGAIFLVINFKTSSALANAYAFAISATMLMTTIAFGYVAVDRLKWKKAILVFLIPVMLFIDGSFFIATVTKIIHGAWVPLLMGLIIAWIMYVWREGQSALESYASEHSISWEEVEEAINTRMVAVIPSTGIYLSSTPNKVPQALASQLKNLHSCPEKILIVSVIQGEVPIVDNPPLVKQLNHRVQQMRVWVGYKQDVNVQRAIINHVMTKEEEALCTYYLADRKIAETDKGQLRGIKEKLFATLHRNAATASNYFGLPEDRIITIGTQLEL